MDWARCVPGLLGVGLPLLALLPLGLGVQVGLPGVDNLMKQFGINSGDFSKQIQDANSQLQRQLGIQNAQAQRIAADIDARLRAIHPEAGRIAGGVAIAGISLLAIGMVAQACMPGAGNGSADGSAVAGSATSSLSSGSSRQGS